MLVNKPILLGSAKVSKYAMFISVKNYSQPHSIVDESLTEEIICLSLCMYVLFFSKRYENLLNLAKKKTLTSDRRRKIFGCIKILFGKIPQKHINKKKSLVERKSLIKKMIKGNAYVGNET